MSGPETSDRRTDTDDSGFEWGDPDDATDATDEPTREDLRARVDLLEAETGRLRELYAASRRSSYRRTALGLAALGGVGLAGAALFPDARTVLVVLGAIGLFGGLLTYYLTPERFVAADVAERVYDALAGNEAALAADLGLSDERVYLPDGDAATLFVPQRAGDELPAVDDIEGPLVVTDDARGLALEPTGAALFEEFERTLAGPLADSPGPLVEQVTDALVETFEFARSTEIDLDAGDGRVTVGVREAAYGQGFDTPPASLVAVALATGLDAPVRASVAPADEADYAVTCRWESGD